MPFGGDCEYADFDACVKANKDKDDPKAYCATLQDKTEEHCKKANSIGIQAIMAQLETRATSDSGSRAPRGRRPWTWDPDRNAYVDADGNVLDDADVRDLLTRFLEVQRQRAEDATRRLISNEYTLPEWENEMRWVLKDSYGASYLLGRGGRNVMDMRDWGRVGRTLQDQYRFLNQFAGQLAAGSVSEARALQRANLYPLSAKQAEARAAATTRGVPDLPAYPGDGSTECYSNCGCYWQLEEVTLGDGSPGWNATWVRGKTDSCVTCIRREVEWAPYVVRA